MQLDSPVVMPKQVFIFAILILVPKFNLWVHTEAALLGSTLIEDVWKFRVASLDFVQPDLKS